MLATHNNEKKKEALNQNNGVGKKHKKVERRLEL